MQQHFDRSMGQEIRQEVRNEMTPSNAKGCKQYAFLLHKQCRLLRCHEYAFNMQDRSAHPSPTAATHREYVWVSICGSILIGTNPRKTKIEYINDK